MAKNDQTSAIIDFALKTIVLGGTLTAAMLIPNVLILADKPLQNFLNSMDKRSQQREARRILLYMKKKRFIANPKGYDHGLKITPEGRKRFAKAQLEKLNIPVPMYWDKKWRLVLYDIPEKHKTGRDMLTRKLGDLGFYQLQRSVFVHPYPCKNEILAVCSAYGIHSFVSYIETDHIDQESILLKKFKHLKT